MQAVSAATAGACPPLRTREERPWNDGVRCSEYRVPVDICSSTHVLLPGHPNVAGPAMLTAIEVSGARGPSGDLVAMSRPRASPARRVVAIARGGRRHGAAGDFLCLAPHRLGGIRFCSRCRTAANFARSHSIFFCGAGYAQREPGAETERPLLFGRSMYTRLTAQGQPEATFE